MEILKSPPFEREANPAGSADRPAGSVVCSRSSHRNRLWGRYLWVGRVVPLILVAMGSLTGGTPQSSVPPEPPSEYQVKAAFLYNFAKFVEWPAAAFADDRAPFTLCIVGEDLFGSALSEIAAHKNVKGRTLAVKHLKEEAGLRTCHILFVNSSEKKKLARILGILRGSHVLTVGEMDGFGQSGGMINFVLEENRVHFEINVEAADRAGLKISSKLLELAHLVADSPRGGTI
jgi:uncharacterized protein DUF4154